MSVHVSAPATTAAGATGWRRHAWIGVLAVGLALFLAVERTLVATQNPNMIPTTILLGAAVVPAAFVAFISGRRLRYAVTGTVVAATAFFGGVIGLVVAGTLEFDVQHDLGGLPMIGVGLIEETSKLIVPLAILLFLRRYRTPADGLLIGVASGAGFAAMETMGYAFTTLVASRGSITDTVDELLLRGLLSPAGHMAWTGITATALYTAAASGWRGRKVGGFVLAFLVAVGLHALWDSRHSLLGMAVVGTASLALLAFTAHRCAVQQRSVHVAATEPLPRPGRRA